ncbi:MAG: hypothetical protein QOI25_4639 [Mycobacterium sp.]|jgi:hypothetical protein|nr:hypothetical protein [Mycobacterium sp.]
MLTYVELSELKCWYTIESGGGRVGSCWEALQP